MRRKIFAVLAVLVASAVSAQTKINSTVEQQLALKERVRVIVLTRPDVNVQGGGIAMSAPQEYLASKLGKQPNTVARIGTLPASVMQITQGDLAALRADPNVAMVAADIPVPPLLVESVPFVHADRAHAAGITGSGWAVAVLDTGVDTGHPSLREAVVAEACFSTVTADVAVRSLCPGQLDVSTVAGASGGCPRTIAGCEHGTHVAGIVAGRHMQVSGQPFESVAPGASVVAVQVFTQFDGPEYCGSKFPCVLSYPSDQLRALEWIYRRQAALRIAAVNMSLGGGAHDGPCDAQSPLTEVIERLRAANVATVIAAGNSRFFDSVAEPGCISAAVTVAGLNRQGQIDTTYSNMAAMVDVAAPGTDILSTVPGGGFARMTGTSMAAPHVAASFALLRQLNPTATEQAIEQILRRPGHAVTDPRTGISVAALDVPSRAPANAAFADIVKSTTAPGKSMAAFDALGYSVHRSFIVRDKDAVPVATGTLESNVKQACAKATCKLQPIAPGTWKLDVQMSGSDAGTSKSFSAGDLGKLLDSKKFAVYDNTPVAPIDAKGYDKFEPAAR